MARRIVKDGKVYRKRRGRLVEIPSEWVGQTLHPQTKNKRKSKQIRKRRRGRGLARQRRFGKVRP